jgi:hypothetical protein
MDLTEKRAKDALKSAKAQWGTGWMHLSEKQREGAVALEVMGLLTAQDEEFAPPALIRLQNVALAAMELVQRESLSPVARRSR